MPTAAQMTAYANRPLPPIGGDETGGASKKGSGIGGGAIAGIVIGVLVGVAVLLALLALPLVRRRRARGRGKASSEGSASDMGHPLAKGTGQARYSAEAKIRWLFFTLLMFSSHGSVRLFAGHEDHAAACHVFPRGAVCSRMQLSG
jgi:hypothetical protein